MPLQADHELMLCDVFAITRQVKFYAFFGMIGNVPLVPLTKMLSDTLGDDQQVRHGLLQHAKS